jgi:hypothetical protein
MKKATAVELRESLLTLSPKYFVFFFVIQK